MNTFNQPCYQKTSPNVCSASVRHSADTSCSCKKSPFPMNTSLAMAYVPFQQSGEVYPCDKALCRGTIFPCLDKPFLMGCCK